MSDKISQNGFIPKHGGYRNLLGFKKAEIIYDGTVYFCKRFFNYRDRTIDQMVQAARSGKQNIASIGQARLVVPIHVPCTSAMPPCTATTGRTGPLCVALRIDTLKSEAI